MSKTFNAIKSNRNGKCGNICGLSVNSRPYDLSVSWRKNNHGGIIQLNYVKYNYFGKKDFTFNQDKYGSSGTIIIDFLNNTGLSIDNIKPDAIVHIEIMRSDNDTITLLIPFAVASKQGSFPVTKGSELIHKITNELHTYQPSPDDPSTKMGNVNINNFFPEDSDYYYALSNTNKKYIILRKFQALKKEDEDILFNGLFKLDTDDENREMSAGTALNIQKYYISTQNIKISGEYRNNSQEGFIGGMTREGFDNSEIYIDCRPVGADEETEEVDMKYEDKGLSPELKKYLLIMVAMIVGCIIFVLIIYLMNLGLKEF